MTAAFEALIDDTGSLMRTRFFGVVTAAHMAGALAAVEALLPRLRPGFTVLTDLSGLDSMEVECGRDLSRIMDHLKTSGVSRVVRVIPDRSKDIGFNILSIIHYRKGVQILTCTTLAEGERALQ